MDFLKYNQKDFRPWMEVKSSEHNRENKQLYYKEGEVYWMSIGTNVGSEQDGKGRKFARPVLVIKGFSSTLVWGVPLSTTKNRGPLYHVFQMNGKTSVALLSQMRSLDLARVTSPRIIGKVSTIALSNIKQKLREILT